MPTQSNFKAAWWLSNPHLQTLGAKIFQRKKIITYPEILTLPDGDFVELAWTETPQHQNTKPIVVVLHGLEGSKNSHYARSILSTIKTNGWIGLLMHFRGCGQQSNRLANSYHSGDTRDIFYLTTQLQQRFKHCQFSALGFSLGGNVLTKYLAKYPDNPYQAAAVICAPLDLASCSERINSGFSRVYQKYLLDMLKASALKKIKAQLISHICTAKLKAIETIKEFDEKITAPLNGFSDAMDYYQQASGKTTIQEIKQPCLFIHASDDPFLNHQQTLPKEPLPAHLTFEISSKGGHVGFITGKNPFKPKFWLEQRVPEFFANYFAI